jgi:hypothetical protein
VDLGHHCRGIDRRYRDCGGSLVAPAGCDAGEYANGGCDFYGEFCSYGNGQCRQCYSYG